MISEEEREQVRRATDFVSLVSETVMLRQNGSEFWGCCPFHQEKTASFHINPQTGLWYCFSCKKGGDVFGYVMEREHLEFPDAIRYLAERASIELHETNVRERGPKRNRLVETLEFSRDFYHRMLMRGKGADADACRKYLAGRGFGSDVCRRWKLGFAPGHGSLVRALQAAGFTRQEMIAADVAVERSGKLYDRFFARAMFPISDEQGRCIAFGGRVLDNGQPKYLNSRETRLFQKSTKLFGFDRAKDAIVNEALAVVVEGYTDVISLSEAGMHNVVATLGTALSEQHLRLLSRFAKTIVYMFDGDDAGQRAAESAIQYIDKTEASMLCVVLPDKLDPADFIGTRGLDALKNIIKTAQPLMDFVFEKRLSAYDLSVPGRRVAAFNELAALLAPLKNSVALDEYASRLADALGMDLDYTRKKIRETAPKNTRVTQNYAASGSPQHSPVAQQHIDESALSLDDRTQLQAERELLALILRYPTVLRTFEQRIKELMWVDSRHRDMAYAMLSQVPTSTSDQLLGAAAQVCSEAAQILASAQQVARLKEQNLEAVRDLAEFELLNAELCSSRRQIRNLRHQMDSQVIESPDELLKRASELQKRVISLEKRLSLRK